MSGSRRFYDLSEELLTAFVERLIIDYNWSRKFKLVPCLRKLRLVSPRFAYLDYIQKFLFTHIQLIASPEHLEHVRKTDVGRIAPFAREILFVALPNGWTLTLDGFKEIVTGQAIVEYKEEHAIWDPDLSSFQGNVCNVFIEKYWDGKQPFTDEELYAGFEE